MKSICSQTFEYLAFKILLAILIITPLFFNLWSCMPYELDSITIFRFFVEIIFIIWLVRCKNLKQVLVKIYNELKKYNFFSLEFLLILYVLVYSLASFFSTHFSESILGLDDRLMGLFTIGHGILLFFLIKDLISKSKFYKIIKILAFVSVPVCLYAILQSFGIDFPTLHTFYASADKVFSRSFSTLGHPNYLGLFLSMIIIFTFLLAWKSKKNVWQVLFFFIIILQVVSLILTLTRSAWLAFAGSMLVFIICLIIFFPKKKEYYKHLIIFVVLIVIVVGFYKGLIKTRTSEGFSQSTGYTRMQDYKFAWSKILQRPILGYGPETYMYLSTERQISEQEMAIDDRISDRVHNVFLDVLINTGFIGLIIYLFIWVKILHLIWQGLKNKSIEILAIFSSLAAYFIWMNFNFDFSISLILFFIILAALNGLNAEQKGILAQKKHVEFTKGKVSWPLLIFIVLLLLLAIYTNIWHSVQGILCYFN